VDGQLIVDSYFVQNTIRAYKGGRQTSGVFFVVLRTDVAG